MMKSFDDFAVSLTKEERTAIHDEALKSLQSNKESFFKLNTFDQIYTISFECSMQLLHRYHDWNSK